MTYKIDEIEGIGPAMKDKLLAADIKSTDDLLKVCCDKNGRAKISEQTGCTEKQLLKWVDMADLMRVSGVGGEYSELLYASGVESVKELRNRNADNLAAAMATVNAEKKLARAVPAASVVAKWVEQAKTLDPLITH